MIGAFITANDALTPPTPLFISLASNLRPRCVPLSRRCPTAQLLRFDPRARMTVPDALRHPYLAAVVADEKYNVDMPRAVSFICSFFLGLFPFSSLRFPSSR